jgi:hypothetical protein
VGSDLECDSGPDGNLCDGGWTDWRRVSGCGAEPRRERVDEEAGSGFRRVDGDGGKLRNWRERGGVEGGDGHWGHGGDSSSSWLTGGRGRKEGGWNRAKLCGFKHRTAPAGRTASLPALLSDGAESGDVDITIVINRHLSELLRERNHGSERFRKGGTGEEGISSGLEESQLIDIGKSGEEEGQARGGRDELDGDEGEGRESDYQGRFYGSEVDPETVDLHEIVGGRHYWCCRKGMKIRKKRFVVS